MVQVVVVENTDNGGFFVLSRAFIARLKKTGFGALDTTIEHYGHVRGTVGLMRGYGRNEEDDGADMRETGNRRRRAGV